jgi:hypothetical protein
VYIHISPFPVADDEMASTGGDHEADPGPKGALFLSWLKRNGSAKHLTTCEHKLRHLGLSLESVISEWGEEMIIVARSRGDRVVWLRDVVWADRWAAFHGVEVPHHAQFVVTKEKLR